MHPATRLILPLLPLGVGFVPPLAAAGHPRFNHAACFVRDLQVSTAFYRDAAGLPVNSEPFQAGRHRWFEVGPQQAFRVAYEILASEPATVTRRPDGVNQIYCQDPDGNWSEINDAKE